MPSTPTPPGDFELLIAGHLDSAYSLARWLVRDPALADDVVQDAMLRAFKYFHGFRGGNARAWVLQIVRNVAVTRLKAAADSPVTTSLDAARGEHEEAIPRVSMESSVQPETTLMREEDEQLVQTLLAKLPVELRECLVLRELEELSYKEI